MFIGHSRLRHVCTVPGSRRDERILSFLLLRFLSSLFHALLFMEHIVGASVDKVILSNTDGPRFFARFAPVRQYFAFVLSDVRGRVAKHESHAFMLATFVENTRLDTPLSQFHEVRHLAEIREAVSWSRIHFGS